MVAAYGGDEAVAQLASFRMDASLTPVLRKEPGRTRRDFQAPDQLRVEIVYPSSTELRLLDGESSWRGLAGSASSWSTRFAGRDF